MTPSLALWLRIEGLAIGAVAIGLYAQTGASWWLFAALALAPDLAMLGTLAGPRVGAAAYNAAHTYVGPLLLGLATPVWEGALPVALVWVAHIGLDRALGYGLRSSRTIRATHLDPAEPSR